MRRTIIGAAIAAALTWAPAQVSATLLAYEGFDYDPGTGAIATGGGTGWLGNWDSSPDFTIGATGLSQGSLQVSGRAATGPESGSFDSSRQFSSINSGSLWFSFLITSAPGSYTKLMLRNTGFASPVYVGVEPWESSIHTGNSFDALNIGTRNQQYFIIGRIDFDAGDTPGNEAARVWVVTAPTSPSADAPSDASATFTDTDVGDLGTLNRVRLHLSDPNSSIDEIRLGTTYADVVPVPEPAAVTLFAIAGLVCCRRRR